MLIALLLNVMYNILMTHTRLLRRAALATLLIPTIAFAYTSPEEVLSGGENARFFNPPPSPRETESVQAAQQAAVAARREEEQARLLQKVSSSSSSSTDSVADDDPLRPSTPVSGQNASLRPEELRILERVRAQQMDADMDARVQMLIAQQGLHSGAPLSHTGPETTIAGFVLAGAGLWTIWKAKRMEARSK